MLAPATFVLAEILQVSLDRVAELSGYQLLVVGCFGFVQFLLTEIETDTGDQAAGIGVSPEVRQTTPIRFCSCYGSHRHVYLHRERREL